MIDKALLGKVKNAKSVDELIAFASKGGITLSQKEADKYFNNLIRKGEMSDDELDSVSGGGCVKEETKCPACGIGEPIWYQSRKTGDIKIGCTKCPVELDYLGGRYIVISENLKL